ncbi:hypothetical protein KY347_01555 [Candidatus Woesearchaeota archaeon]|nr:hypothetical protein [Candidatus Woesearchaeota archaeon]
MKKSASTIVIEYKAFEGSYIGAMERLVGEGYKPAGVEEITLLTSLAIDQGTKNNSSQIFFLRPWDTADGIFYCNGDIKYVPDAEELINAGSNTSKKQPYVVVDRKKCEDIEYRRGKKNTVSAENEEIPLDKDIKKFSLVDLRTKKVINRRLKEGEVIVSGKEAIPHLMWGAFFKGNIAKLEYCTSTIFRELGTSGIEEAMGVYISPPPSYLLNSNSALMVPLSVHTPGRSVNPKSKLRDTHDVHATLSDLLEDPALFLGLRPKTVSQKKLDSLLKQGPPLEFAGEMEIYVPVKKGFFS